MKTTQGISLKDVLAVYDGPEGDLWELIMGEQIHIGGFSSSMALAENPLGELTKAYMESIPDAFRRPNDKLYQWIKATFTERKVEGVLLIRRIWCDNWHGEVGRLREWLDIPLLDIDLDGDAGAFIRRTARQTCRGR